MSDLVVDESGDAWVWLDGGVDDLFCAVIVTISGDNLNGGRELFA